MSGFGPIGGLPIASMGAAIAGTYYSPGTVTIVFEGLGPPVLTGVSPISFQQAVREVMRGGPNARNFQILQAVREVLRSEGVSSPLFQTRQVVREVLRAGDAGIPEFQTRQIVREILRAGSGVIPEFHVRQITRELLRSSIEVTNLRRRQLILPNVGRY